MADPASQQRAGPGATAQQAGSLPELLEALWADGATVAAYDPKAAEEAERLSEALADGRLMLAATKEEAIKGADALVIGTEWKRYRYAGLRLHGTHR